MEDNKTMKPLIVLTGPTAAGKTALSLKLAKEINGEIISADSMQVYRYMDIGTAKIRPEQMQGIRHHLIDILQPDEDFNVVLFQQLAGDAIRTIYASGKIPVVVGGSGFYIQALVNAIDFTQTNADPTLRMRLQELAANDDTGQLYRRLRMVDPGAAAAIHPHNTRRIIRALEFYEKTGQRISEHNEEQKKKISPYHYACFVLTWPRDILYARINQRVDDMIAAGLPAEVKALLDAGYGPDLVSMQGLGYKELIPYLRGEYTLADAGCLLKKNTRHFAKRQITWFKSRSDSIWIDKSTFPNDEAILVYIIRQLQTAGILTDSMRGDPNE